MYVFMSKYVFMHHLSAGVHGSSKGVGFTGTGVTNSCEGPVVGTENQFRSCTRFVSILKC